MVAAPVPPVRQTVGPGGGRLSPRTPYPGTTKAPPCMRWRGSAGPTCPAATEVTAGLRRAAPRRHELRLLGARSRGTGAPRGLRSRSLGSAACAERAPRGLRSRSLGSAACAKRCSRWVTVPDRSGPAPPWSCPTRPSAPDRSGSAPGWDVSRLALRSRSLGLGTWVEPCPAGSALIAQGPPARDCPASSCPDRSGPAVAERVTEAVLTIARLSIPRNPSPVPVNPR